MLTKITEEWMRKVLFAFYGHNTTPAKSLVFKHSTYEYIPANQ